MSSDSYIKSGENFSSDNNQQNNIYSENNNNNIYSSETNQHNTHNSEMNLEAMGLQTRNSIVIKKSHKKFFQKDFLLSRVISEKTSKLINNLIFKQKIDDDDFKVNV